MQLVQGLFVFESVHWSEETVIAVGGQLSLADEAMERIKNKVFASTEVVKDVRFEDEEPGV